MRPLFSAAIVFLFTIFAFTGTNHVVANAITADGIYQDTTRTKDTANSKKPVVKEKETTSDCGKHKGKQLYKGPRGGCYYINSKGNKTYVDKSECNC